MQDNLKCCYVTVGIRTNYFKMAYRLQERLKYLNSQYEHFILTDQNTFIKNKDYIEQHNIKYKIIEALNFNTSDKAFYYYTLSKISALLLEDYDLVCNIDSDCILKTNLDYLFNNSDFLASSYNVELFKLPSAIGRPVDTNIFLAKPSIKEYNRLLAFSKLNPDLRVDDQVFGYFYTNNIYPEYLDTNSFIHIGGIFKPWNLTFDKYAAILVNDLESIEYNKLLDLNLDLIKQYHDTLIVLNNLNKQFNIENIDKLKIDRDENLLGN